MENVFEQPTKMMEQAYEQWRQMMTENSPWTASGGKLFRENMVNWVSSLNSTYSANMEAWNTFMQHNQEVFFKMFKESPFFTEASESRMRETWDNMLKAQQTYQDIVKDNLEKMETTLKEAEKAE